MQMSVIISLQLEHSPSIVPQNNGEFVPKPPPLITEDVRLKWLFKQHSLLSPFENVFVKWH